MQWADGVRAAIANVCVHGDTDVFPLPLENRAIADRKDKFLEYVRGFHASLDTALSSHPIKRIDALCQAGYAGFRWATQLDPFWNAYLLGIVASVGDKIEATRPATTSNVVFSYRFRWDELTSRLFDRIGWLDYRRECRLRSVNAKYVVLTDISDFYARIYHHRIKNALLRLPEIGDIPSRVDKLLSQISGGTSYGLPIGGNASRILAELSLTDVDNGLTSKNIGFCRFADDFTLFCPDETSAFSALVFLTERLHLEGLGLNKQKTRILKNSDFQLLTQRLDPDSENGSDEQRLLSISLRYDPYSATAEEDYAALAAALNSIDLIGVIHREVRKSAIDESVVRQALGAVRVLDSDEQTAILQTLLQSENVLRLIPVFSNLMRAVRDIYPTLNEEQQALIDDRLFLLRDENPQILKVSVNLAFYCEALAAAPLASIRKEQFFQFVLDNSSNVVCRRIAIAAFAKWRRHHALRALKDHFATMNPWERSVLLVASYELGDEGNHWRALNRNAIQPGEQFLVDWAAERKQRNQPIPW